MAKYKSDDIRSVVLCGHGGAGKTMLAEAMLFKSKAISRLGQISDGSTVSDHDPDEKHRQCSLSTDVMHCTFEGKEFRIIDTPGAMDFVGGMVSGMGGADLAIICINAAKGIEVMSRKAWDYAGKMGLPRVIAITHMDSENINFQETLTSIKDVFGKNCVRFTIPQGEGPGFSGVTRVMAEGATGDGVEELHMQITESAVECDDELMEKYLEGGEVTPQEVRNVLRKAVITGSLVPVFCLSSGKDLGIEELMEGLVEWGATPYCVTHKLMNGDDEEEFQATEDGPFIANVFKVVSDAHVGKISFMRILSGKLEAKGSACISSTGKQERFAQMFISQGEKREEISEAITGDIIAVTKVEGLQVGDTVHDKGVELRYPEIPFPQPMTGLAVTSKSRNDEQKMGTYFHRLCEEDRTFVFVRDDMTGEHVIRGMGQLHLDVMLSRLKGRFGLEVNTKPPKIPYLETISNPGDGKYRHKKQSGGSGQFGEVWMRFKPNTRGEGFEFVNSIVGGSVSQPFIPSVEKGVRAAMENGPIAGFPVVDVVAELYDGKEHPVDSKDIAFQLAGKHCFEEVVQKCKPVLLEPVVDMEIVFPSSHFGDVSGDISSRRGRPTGTDQLGSMQVLKAQVPLAEVADYGSTLSGITQGEGFYTMELSHYDPVPSNIAQQVAARVKAEAEEEKK